MSRLDVTIDEGRFRLRLPYAFGVASSTFLHRRQARERAVLAHRVAFAAVGDAGLLRMGLMEEIERLMLPDVEHARKNKPSDKQCRHDSQRQRNKAASHFHFSAVQSFLE